MNKPKQSKEFIEWMSKNKKDIKLINKYKKQPAEFGNKLQICIQQLTYKAMGSDIYIGYNLSEKDIRDRISSFEEFLSKYKQTHDE